MKNEEDRREYPRLPSEVNVRLYKAPVDRVSQNYLAAIAENLGEHGVFIQTEYILPKGSIVYLEFDQEDHPGEKEPIRIKAIVRWVRRWRKPRGMGLLFIEFEGVAKSNLAEFLLKLYEMEEEEDGQSD